MKNTGIKRYKKSNIKILSILLSFVLSFVFILPHKTNAANEIVFANVSTDYGRYTLKAFQDFNIIMQLFDIGFETNSYKSAIILEYNFNNLYSGTLNVKFNKSDYVSNTKAVVSSFGGAISIQNVNTSNYSYTLRLEECLGFTLAVPLGTNISGPSVIISSYSLNSVVPTPQRLSQLYSQIQSVNNRLATTNATLSSILTAIQNQGGSTGGGNINFKQWYRDYSLSANAFLNNYTRSNAWLNSSGSYQTQNALATQSDSYYGYEYTFSSWNTRDNYYTHGRSFSVAENQTNYFIVLSTGRLISNDSNATIYPKLYYRFGSDSFNGNNWGKYSDWSVEYIDRMGEYIIYTFTINNPTNQVLDVSIDFGLSSFRLIPMYLGSDYNMPAIIEQITKIDTDDKYTKLLSSMIESVQQNQLNYDRLQEMISNSIRLGFADIDLTGIELNLDHLFEINNPEIQLKFDDLFKLVVDLNTNYNDVSQQINDQIIDFNTSWDNIDWQVDRQILVELKTTAEFVKTQFESILSSLGDAKIIYTSAMGLGAIAFFLGFRRESK